jgi:hypothetical protein
VWFHTFEQEGRSDNPDKFTGNVAGWSLLDAAARQVKADALSVKRLNRERRDEWRACLAPIRDAYQAANNAQRRAIRTLLIDDLLRG